MTQSTREDRRPMTSYALALRASARPEALPQFQFPADEGLPGDEGGDADKTNELPRRAIANATQEIDAADVLAVEPIDHHPSSVIPVAIDLVARPSRPRERPRAQDQLDAQPKKARGVAHHGRLGWGLGAAIFGTGCLVLAIVNAVRPSPADAAAPVAAALVTPSTSPPAAGGASVAPVAGRASAAPAQDATKGGVPVVSINNLPRVTPTTGTIRLIEAAAAHRLWVDGNLAAGPSAVVSCGTHMIKVGSAGTAHAMVIGCGEETVIAR